MFYLIPMPFLCIFPVQLLLLLFWRFSSCSDCFWLGSCCCGCLCGCFCSSCGCCWALVGMLIPANDIVLITNTAIRFSLLGFMEPSSLSGSNISRVMHSQQYPIRSHF